jgi:hypothetical protein
MTQIDHRILIPKSPVQIWELVSDLQRNTEWQVDCESVSILTTKRTGSGVRWRYRATNGREYVLETSAWYDGLGYEYAIVDGVSFRENKGRIRLQEIAEGTVVQWTFSYEVAGVLGGVRNAMSIKRQTESVMIDSLKTLWKVIQKSAADGPREIKSLMRDAPDYESRAHYRSRHSGKNDADLQPEDLLPVSLDMSEPPINEEDTRPRVAVVSEAGLGTVDRLDPVQDVPSDYADEVLPVLQEKPLANDGVRFARPVDDSNLIVSRDSTKPPAKAEPVVVVEPPREPEDSATITKPIKREPLPPIPLHDTGEISVFDLFGIPRPSQTQPMKPVVLEDEVKNVTPVEVRAVEPVQPRVLPSGGRMGMRIIARRRLLRLRRPV